MRAAAGAALLAAAAFSLSGCGDDGGSTASASCKALSENRAQAAVIVKAYERGDLGTRAQVQSHFAADDRIFDAEGRMLPYRSLHGLTRAHFDDFIASDAIPGEVQHKLADAREQVREQGYPGC